VLGWYIKPVQLNANLVAQLDCLCSFTQLAIENQYVCLGSETSTGNHRTVDIRYQSNCQLVPYIPNDIFLDRETGK
jgi:DNA mismatch repair protein MutS